MKYLINSADFTKFDYKFNKFVENYKNDKNINKVNIYYRKFRKFCFIFKNKNGLLPTCTCGGNNEIEWVQQCFSNRTGLFKIYSKFEEKQMYHVFLNKFEYF
ncbi:hypothetical protein [Spiroplasma ixodetis]|uniref:hypothetical protein n=1 Tax=Spiroplasma ixodetis TaxID=2141 RepID=UPI0025754B40|nr:hypothetical protein [Spiroplasma ixodetis]